MPAGSGAVPMRAVDLRAGGARMRECGQPGERAAGDRRCARHSGRRANLIGGCQMRARCIQIDSLTIVDTAIPTIQPAAFRDFTIVRLVLNRNTLSQVADDAFAGPLL